MEIIKGNKVFIVTEWQNVWHVKRVGMPLDVAYNVDKALAPDAEALRDYVLTNDAF